MILRNQKQQLIQYKNTPVNKFYFNIVVPSVVSPDIERTQLSQCILKLCLKIIKKINLQIVLRSNFNVNNTYNISSITFKKCNNCEKIKPVFCQCAHSEVFSKVWSGNVQKCVGNKYESEHL